MRSTEVMNQVGFIGSSLTLILFCIRIKFPNQQLMAFSSNFELTSIAKGMGESGGLVSDAK